MNTAKPVNFIRPVRIGRLGVNSSEVGEAFQASPGVDSRYLNRLIEEKLSEDEEEGRNTNPFKRIGSDNFFGRTSEKLALVQETRQTGQDFDLSSPVHKIRRAVGEDQSPRKGKNQVRKTLPPQIGPRSLDVWSNAEMRNKKRITEELLVEWENEKDNIERFISHPRSKLKRANKNQ